MRVYAPNNYGRAHSAAPAPPRATPRSLARERAPHGQALAFGYASREPVANTYGDLVAASHAPSIQFEREPGAEASPAAVQRAAQAGICGPGGALPHLAEIQRSFGPEHDLGAVQAHVGSEAVQAGRALSAKAYATRDHAQREHVAFRYSPDLHLAAHEAAHVIQQRQGVRLSDGIGRTGDLHERRAEQVAARVVGRQSASDLLRGEAQPPAEPVVQRYSEVPVSAQKSDHFPVGIGIRVSDDGRLAVAQESIYGSQQCWAEASLISAASATLSAAKSVIRLKAGADTLKGKAADGSTRVLNRVEPENVDTQTSGTNVQIWADCGKSASDVLGASQGTGDGQPEAVYKDKAGKEVRTTWPGPTYMKWQIMLSHFGDKIDAVKVEALFTELFKALDEAGKTADKAKKKALEDKGSLLAWQIETMIFAAYEKMSTSQKDAFDSQAGTNRYAAPIVGQGYSISTGGPAKPGYENNTWNFHWAGVVLHSGGDNVVLENYAVGDATKKNSDWKLQMYGSAAHLGQTFHEQHRDVHKQHGESPTTMTVERK